MPSCGARGIHFFGASGQNAALAAVRAPLKTMQSLELKIPPPLVAGILALLMWGGVRLWLPTDVPPYARLVAANLLVVAGLGFDLAGFISFRRARTTINPFKPATASALVHSGVYRITRNPMYVGLTLILLGLAVYLWSPWAAPGPLVFAAYIRRFQIAPEERALSALFGEQYLVYQRKVRRWL